MSQVKINSRRGFTVGLYLISNEISYNLTGQVRHQGLPVSRVRVAVFQVHPSELRRNLTRPLATQTTGPRGEFTFGVKPGSYVLAVLPGKETRFLNHYSEVVTVDGNMAFTINLVTGHVVSGKVVTATAGKFEWGSIVALPTTANNCRAQSDITSDGYYSLILPKGNAYLAHIASKTEVPGADTVDGDNVKSILSSNLLDETSKVVTCSHFRTEVVRDQTLDLTFPTFVEATYAVTDMNEQPIANALISLGPCRDDDDELDWGFDICARSKTDKNGAAKFFVEPGLYHLKVDPEESSAFFTFRQNELALHESSKKTIKLASGFRLRGQVNFSGKPQPNCAVTIVSAVNKSPIRLQTNGDGRFSAALQSGPCRISVNPPQQARWGVASCAGETAGRPAALNNEVQRSAERRMSRAEQSAGSCGGETAGRSGALNNEACLAPWVRSIVVGGDTQIAVTLKEGALVSGKVTCLSGQPRVGVRVFVFEKGAMLFESPEFADAITSTVTDEYGFYCLNLLPGTYQFVVHRDYQNAQEVSIPKEGIATNLTWSGWSQVKFEVQDETGRPVPYCRLRCFPYSREGNEVDLITPDRLLLPNDRLITNEEGICQITVPSGLYSFELMPGKNTDLAPRTIRQLSVNGDLVRKITLNSAVAASADSIASSTII
jgi:hypothetical protein